MRPTFLPYHYPEEDTKTTEDSSLLSVSSVISVAFLVPAERPTYLLGAGFAGGGRTGRIQRSSLFSFSRHHASHP